MQAKTSGLSLIVIGVIMMIYTGFDYVTTEKMLDIGPLKINKEENHPIHWPPIVGIVLITVGIVITVGDKKVRV